jgi:hypothetical protein
MIGRYFSLTTWRLDAGDARRYDFENFVDDLRAYDEECVDHGMRALDAVGFLKEMQ